MYVKFVISPSMLSASMLLEESSVVKSMKGLEQEVSAKPALCWKVSKRALKIMKNKELMDI